MRIHLLNWYVISVRLFICHSRPVIPSALRTSPRPLTLILGVVWWATLHSDRQQFLLSPSGRRWSVLQMLCVVMLGLRVQGQRAQLGVVPVTCQSELLHVGHINLNNEKSPRGWGGAGKWNNNCEGEICLWISQAFFGPWVLLRLFAILFFLGKNKAYLTQDSICKYLIEGWSSSICISLSYFLLNTS